MTHVEITIAREEIESIEIALRALHGEQAALERYGVAASRLSLAIDDLDGILSRIQHQRDQATAIEQDQWSRRVGLRAVRS